MFHIKVSYTSSFSAAFRSPIPPFTRSCSYARIRQPIESRTATYFFYFGSVFSTLRFATTTTNQWQEVGRGWGEMKMSRDRAVKKLPTVTDRNSFFLHKNKKKSFTA